MKEQEKNGREETGERTRKREKKGAEGRKVEGKDEGKSEETKRWGKWKREEEGRIRLLEKERGGACKNRAYEGTALTAQRVFTPKAAFSEGNGTLEKGGTQSRGVETKISTSNGDNGE